MCGHHLVIMATDNKHSFEAALSALFGPLHNQVTTAEAAKKAEARRHLAVHEMRTYMKRLAASSISLEPLPNQRIIHISGTKGKGSTSAISEVLCRKVYGKTTGLFTSPHLCDIRERIRVNGLPVSKETFATAYWKLRTALERFGDETEVNEDDSMKDLSIIPGYFRMLTLMALYIFTNYQNPDIEVIILEVGMGGRYDATNSWNIGPNTICATTLIDYDHVRVLGYTLEAIAWHKGGIYLVDKEDTKNLTIQPSSTNEERKLTPPSDKPIQTTAARTFFALDSNTSGVIEVLRDCARVEGRGGKLELAGPKATPELVKYLPSNMGLAGDHQRQNAVLAIALVQKMLGTGLSDDVEVWQKALESVRWPARCQTIKASENLTVRVDGAHTEHSLQAGFDWFISSKKSSHAKRVLMFFCSHEKNPIALLEILLKGQFEIVLFCRPNSERPSPVPKKTAKQLLQENGHIANDAVSSSSLDAKCGWDETLKLIWECLSSKANVADQEVTSSMSVTEAIHFLQERADSTSTPIDIFATGSLYLAGSVLEVMKWHEEEAPGTLVSSSVENEKAAMEKAVRSYAVMVHKLYEGRVKDYLMLPLACASEKDVEILDPGDIATGVSKDRRGYKLLLLNTSIERLVSLAPMARLNVSWISRLSNRASIHSTPEETTKSSIAPSTNIQLGNLLWKSLQAEYFESLRDFLRVEVHPRQQVNFVCGSLQVAAGGQFNANDPFEGPIVMTKSRKRCTHKLTVVFPCGYNNSGSFLWGVERRPRDDALIDLKINHEAKLSIDVVACDCNTGKEKGENAIDPLVPLSRAYYKLDQVYHDFLKSQEEALRWKEGYGLDLGASPGGWSQVMVHSFKMPKVVAVDSAALADRIAAHSRVVHVKSTMQAIDKFPEGPYSLVVCDACILWMELLDVIQKTVMGKIQCTLPCTWVLTMKLPFRSTGSIQRQIEGLQEKLDNHFLSDMAHSMYPRKEDSVVSKAEILHLMANSDSERTLLLTFKEKL